MSPPVHETDATAVAPVARTPIALTIAGSDSSGGAGIQADLKAFSALGAYGASVITALTAQNTRAVTHIHAVPPEFIRHQLDAVVDDLEVTAIKIGMLASTGVIDVVAGFLAAHSHIPVVLDPVMVAKSGDRLLQPEAVAALREQLLPRATIITPNLPEAADLLGVTEATSIAGMRTQAQQLLATGVSAVLIKGGHLRAAASPATQPADGAHQQVFHTDSDDLLVTGEAITALPSKRIDTRNTHGTGCTLSAAIAACMAGGDSVTEAVLKAKRYVTRAIAGADLLKVGQGHGPVHHFHALWERPGAPLGEL